MKKAIILFLSFALLLSGCVSNRTMSQEESNDAVVEKSSKETNDILPVFANESDDKLITYLEDSVYKDLITGLDSENYFVENVEAVYVSKEYMEELAYNSQSNVFFGYSLSELDKQFEGKRYVFDIDESGKTIVREMEIIDDNTYQKVLNNVLIGGGVILFCVTVSVLSAPASSAVSVIFATSAKTATAYALSSGVLSGAAKTIVTAYETGDFEYAFKEGAISASENFKWGAFSGALAGGASEAVSLYKTTLNGLTINEAAIIQQESGYPLDVISQFKSMNEYQVYKNKIGLNADIIGSKMTLVRDIDLEHISKLPNGEEVSNLVRMQKGYAPIEPASGLPYDLHHVNQDPNGTLAILTKKEHQEYTEIIHIFGEKSKIDRPIFDKIRVQFWKDYAARFGG